MAKKQSSKKPAKKTAKTPKVDAAVPATWPESKPRKERERDPRLPAAGTILKRTYKGSEVKVTVLDDGFRFEGDEYRRSVDVGLSVESGFVCFGVTMAVQGEARLCAIGCVKTEVDSPDLDLYSDTICGTVQCPEADGNCALEPMAVSTP